MTNKLFLFVFCWLIILLSPSYSQESKLSKGDLVRLVREGQYNEAYDGLEQQITRFPKDPDYLYYTAVCRVQTGQKIEEAIPQLLEVCQQKSNLWSWFYLGKAYLLNYQFNEADEAFDRFLDKSSREEQEKSQLETYKRMCTYAKDICSRAKRFNVIKADTVPEDKLITYFNKQQLNGRFEKTEETGVLSSRIKTGIRFKPANSDFIFQSKYPFGKKFKDIYYSETREIEFSDLRNMGSDINTSLEEDFAFYDASIPALYFASQGHHSAGGMDIFVSYPDKPTGKWSKPKGLGFPVNTPYDEIAYVTVPGTHRSLLASRRNCKQGCVVVYTLDNYEQSDEEPISWDEARELGKLKVGKQNFVPFAKNVAPPLNTKLPAKSTTEVPMALRSVESYQRVIHEALDYQIRSDSIRRVSDEKKEALTNAKTESEKTRLWQEIIHLDNKADEVQKKADALYKQAREVEEDHQSDKQPSKENPEALGRKAFSSGKSPKKVKDPDSPAKSENSGFKSKSASNSLSASISYRIQVGVFSKPQQESLFKGLTPIYEEKVNNGAAIRYYVGLYSRITDAEKELSKVKEAGFKDAYVIGFYNGKTVPLSRARELEKSGQNQ